MKQNLQGNISLEFPLIRLNVTDFSLLFNFFLLFKKQKILTTDILPFHQTISCILLCQNPLSQLYPLISVLHLFFL